MSESPGLSTEMKSSATDIAKRCLGLIVGGFLRSLQLLLVLWAVGSVYFVFRLSSPINLVATIAIGLGVVAALFRFRRQRDWMCIVFVACLPAYWAMTAHTPSNDRPWADDHARLAAVRFDGQDVRIENFRHCEYRSELDYDTNYRDFDFKLNELKRVWFGVARFTAVEGLAHTFLSFEVEQSTGSKFFSVSVEIRREQGESFSPLKGLYRQYEIIYVVSDDRDAIGSRTVHRPNDRVYLYLVNATPPYVQALFRDIARRMQRLEAHPEFYHSLFNNCTNNIAAHTDELTPDSVRLTEPTIFIPGYSDRFAFSRGLIGSPGQSFAELRAASRIDEIARRVGIRKDFANLIRSRD